MKTVALAALFVCGASAQQASNFVLVAHSGAGDYSKMTQPVIEARRNGMLQAIQAGYAILAHGGTSIDAVEATIRAMEDSGLYDAGRGAYYTKEGVPEMDAAIMDGRTLQAGSVAALKHIANPIHLARLVMEKTPHVLLVADGAEGSRNRRASNWSRRITSTPSANGTAIKTLRKRSW
ncbi:MAG TPA: isoaspartyl peptidase/L-asparaginase, partial [Bryobacteraceae bacterium]|nr:isoaspartyl peptidase/L-asparaginase [Bryobacteraceae bacterium]